MALDKKTAGRAARGSMFKHPTDLRPPHFFFSSFFGMSASSTDTGASWLNSIETLA